MGNQRFFRLLCLGLIYLGCFIPGRTEERVFFAFDDHSIPWQHNLKVTLVPAQKYAGNPVLRRGVAGSPDFGHAILYGTVIHDGIKFRMWYLAMHETTTKDGQAPGNWRPMCYAESGDGINWIKPELGLVEFNGSRRNNICSITGSPTALTKINDFLSVLYEPDDPDPARRYKAAYIAHVPYDEIRGGLSQLGRKEKTPCVTICATSADGLSWSVVGDQPANVGGERFEVTSLYRYGDFYYTSGQLLSPWAWRADGTAAGRVMLTYRSADFANWSQAKALAFARPGQLMNPPIAGQQTHMGAGVWSRGDVLLGLYGMWQDGPAVKPEGASPLWGTHIDLGLIISNDGLHFREPVTDFKVIARGTENEWDGVALLQGHAFANVGDQTMIWYSHWDTSGQMRSMEIGLATLRRDGFGYLSCKQDDLGGHLLTSLVRSGKSGQRLLLNVENISSESPLTIELVDRLDRPLPGYAGLNGASLSQAGTRHEVIWPKSQSALLPADQQFSIKVKFPAKSLARVYALYVN